MNQKMKGFYYEKHASDYLGGARVFDAGGNSYTFGGGIQERRRGQLLPFH